MLFKLTDVVAEESRNVDYDFLYDMALKMYIDRKTRQVTADAISAAMSFIKKVETTDSVDFRYGKLIMKIEKIDE